jgi:hypothetical protein
MEQDAWLIPLMRGLIGLFAIQGLVAAAWWLFARQDKEDQHDEPFDPGMD